MKALFLRGGIAFAAGILAIVLGLAAQSMDMTKPYTAVAALWPTFMVLLGLVVFVALRREPDPKLPPALGALLMLAFYAFAARRTLKEEDDLYVSIVLSAVPMLGLGGLLLGIALDRLPRVMIVLAMITTAIASAAVIAPSVPWHAFERHRSGRPDIAEIPRMTLAGVLVVDGAAIMAHGVSYRLQHDAFDATWCEVVAESNAPQFPGGRASVIYSCRARPLRCDDERRLCLVEDEMYATGYTFDYEPIGIHGFRQPDGRLAIRVEAWVLALSAIFLLLRSRTSPLRPAMVMSALATSSVAVAMMARFLG